MGGRRRHGAGPPPPPSPSPVTRSASPTRGRSSVSSWLPPQPCPQPAPAPGTGGCRPQAGKQHIQEPGHPDPCPRPPRRPPWGGAGRAVPEGPEGGEATNFSPGNRWGDSWGWGTALQCSPLQGCTLAEGSQGGCDQACGEHTAASGVRQPGAPPSLLQLTRSNRREVGGRGGLAPSVALQNPRPPGAQVPATMTLRWQ